MTQADEPPKVSTFYRILAWVFLAFCVPGTIGWISMAMSGEGMPFSWAEAVLAFLGLLLGALLFGYVAFTGRPPRWWSSIDEMLDIEKALKRHAERRTKR